jgi:hypothetical protein
MLNMIPDTDIPLPPPSPLPPPQPLNRGPKRIASVMVGGVLVIFAIVGGVAVFGGDDENVAAEPVAEADFDEASGGDFAPTTTAAAAEARGVAVFGGDDENVAAEPVAEADFDEASGGEFPSSDDDRITDEDISLASMDAAWNSNKAEICPAYLDVLANGADPDFVNRYALQEFAEGYGEPLTPAMKDRMLGYLASC